MLAALLLLAGALVPAIGRAPAAQAAGPPSYLTNGATFTSGIHNGWVRVDCWLDTTAGFTWPTCCPPSLL